MNAPENTANRTSPNWIAPLCCAAVAGAIVVAVILRLPDSYESHHEWPMMAVIVGFVLFVCGAGKLVWRAIPAHKTGEVLLGIGMLLMFGCWFLWHTLAGVIAGGFVALIGFGMIALRASLSHKGPR